MITEFTIDRKTWVNGSNITSENPSKMLNSEGNMCCLGHFGKACGLNDRDMINLPSPALVAINLPKDRAFPEEMNFLLQYGLSKESSSYSSPVAEKLIEFNDNPTTSSNYYREKKITKIFAEQGIKVTFV